MLSKKLVEELTKKLEEDIKLGKEHAVGYIKANDIEKAIVTLKSVIVNQIKLMAYAEAQAKGENEALYESVKVAFNG